MKIQGAYDYEILYTTFASQVETYLDLVMIELNGPGVQPQGPFLAFDIISPYIASNYLEDDGTKAFECVVSFTVYDKSKVKAITIADAWRSALKTFRMRMELNAVPIVIVQIMNTQIRSVPETTESATMVGFDVRLRLQETFDDTDIDEIKDINLD